MSDSGSSFSEDDLDLAYVQTLQEMGEAVFDSLSDQEKETRLNPVVLQIIVLFVCMSRSVLKLYISLCLYRFFIITYYPKQCCLMSTLPKKKKKILPNVGEAPIEQIIKGDFLAQNSSHEDLVSLGAGWNTNQTISHLLPLN